jgi:hypothetical protein
MQGHAISEFDVPTSGSPNIGTVHDPVVNVACLGRGLFGR